MYSAKNDTVLDPFWGTGTTSQVAMVTQRHSIGYEISKDITLDFFNEAQTLIPESCTIINERLKRHMEFVKNRLNDNKAIKHSNTFYQFPVITKQEGDLSFHIPEKVSMDSDTQLTVSYKQGAFTSDDLSGINQLAEDSKIAPPKKTTKKADTKKPVPGNPLKQKSLF
jgi:hypothetical protein